MRKGICTLVVVAALAGLGSTASRAQEASPQKAPPRLLPMPAYSQDQFLAVVDAQPEFQADVRLGARDGYGALFEARVARKGDTRRLTITRSTIPMIDEVDFVTWDAWKTAYSIDKDGRLEEATSEWKDYSVVAYPTAAAFLREIIADESEVTDFKTVWAADKKVGIYPVRELTASWKSDGNNTRAKITLIVDGPGKGLVLREELVGTHANTNEIVLDTLKLKVPDSAFPAKPQQE
jgi:hypothetical protein